MRLLSWQLIFAALFSVCFIQPASAQCDDGHWVKSVSDDGHVVTLEDDSVWLIDPMSQIDTALWLPTSNITACEGKLINTDDNEVASAKRVQ